MFKLGEDKHGKIIYPNKEFTLRDHESYIKCGNDAASGINIDKIGTVKHTCSKGVFGPILISNFVTLPRGIPIENMHAIWLGLGKKFLWLWCNSNNCKQPWYLGKNT